MHSNEIIKMEEANLINFGGPVVDSEVSLCLYAQDIDIEERTGRGSMLVGFLKSADEPPGNFG